ncbi:5'-nucleotidase C-terminal domain-containing protein [Limimaricola pyoseonensis]|uniref:2',3'-cyclic-nucleotide 2'-phosphodiesterase / 3'-nucleotidase n=1 Tax=Limimaricola pyoseonensis TaxID=521013 RepID=A0A1G7I4D4_9RHOB|nr:5'-nucleotidase C-terminal domain-containing protein [Limimaricola pyoseonensis]SDF07592.1 2',3'-cyclic-nucleotide 2'-phosphodiesterase / 3'-nucleotidase [Limimaricola pyoseonensis]
MDGTGISAGDVPARLRLRLLCTTDLHGQILPWDEIADRPLPGRGLARLAPLVRAHRAGGANVLLFDNGDFLHGTVAAERASRALAAGAPGPHPVVAAMNAMGFDAGTLGNHEFDHGAAALETALSGLVHPVTCANLDDPAGPALPRELMLERHLRDDRGAMHVLRIGVIGLLPPRGAQGGAGRGIAGPQAPAARAALGRLRENGADLVVMLCHGGLDSARSLAALAGIDALFLGHTHALHPTAGAPALPGPPTAMPGALGSHLGVIDLQLAQDDRAGWRVVAGQARLQAPDTAEQGCDWAVTRAALPAHARTRRALARPVSRAPAPIGGAFPLVAPAPALQLMADAMRAAARALLGGHPAAGLPLLSAVHPFRPEPSAGFADLPGGTLTSRHLFALCPHPDRLRLVELPGAVLHDWLEDSARVFRRLLPGRQDQPLLDGGRPPHRFELLDGLEWRIDASRAAGAGRVTGLRHAGRPVRPEDRFVIAVASHRLEMDDPLAERLRAGRLRLPVAEPELRAVLRAHLRARPAAPPPRRGWRFAALPGTAGWFDAAQPEPPWLPGLRLVGPAPGGAWRFELSLDPRGAVRPIDSGGSRRYGGPARTGTVRCLNASKP